MSELIQKNDHRATIRWKLLTGASALALTVYISPIAHADDSSQPQIWIELGGQLSRLEDGQETFAPVFPNSPSRPSMFWPSQKFERPPLYSLDEDSSISFQPKNSDWVFSAAIRYGRSRSNEDVRQQTHPKTFNVTFFGSHIKYQYPTAAKFADTAARSSEHHLILDFQAGKDVGLGLFGSNGSSTVNAGVRFAQFTSKTNIALKSDPDWHFSYTHPLAFDTSFKIAKSFQPYHSNAASLRASRSFHGVGPSVSWNGSVPFAGNNQEAELTLDWGINAALLFGRQRANVHHQATGQYPYKTGNYTIRQKTYAPAPVNETRSRSVTVPNVGGFAGLLVQIFRCEGQLRLSRGHVLRRDGWWHRRAQGRKPRLLRPLCLHQRRHRRLGEGTNLRASRPPARS